MDYQQPIPNRQNKQNGFLTAALVMGILSISTSCCIYISFVCGALGIIFALLSRTDSPRLESQATAGLILSVIGMIATLFITVASVFITIRSYGSFDAFMDAYEETLEDYMDAYGYDDTL